MTLREFLMANIGKRVKIGAYRGSSFIFADDITEKTVDVIQKMSDKQHKKITSNYERLKAKNEELQAFAEEADRLREWVNKFQVSGDMKDATKIYTAKYKGLARTTKEQLGRADVLVRMWEPYLDRKIEQKYKSFTEYKTTIVLIDGVETGSFWKVSEYRNRKEDEADDESGAYESV